MIDFKEEIAKQISKITEIESNEIKGYIEVPKDTKMATLLFHVLI